MGWTGKWMPTQQGAEENKKENRSCFQHSIRRLNSVIVHSWEFFGCTSLIYENSFGGCDFFQANQPEG